MARLARLANCRVEKVSACALIEGEIHTMNFMRPCPTSESLRMRVSFEFRKGICVRDLSIRALMQCPRQDRLPFMLVSYRMRVYR